MKTSRDPIFEELDRRIAEEEAELRRKTRAVRPTGPPAPPPGPAPPKPADSGGGEPAAARRPNPYRRRRSPRRVSEIARSLDVDPWKVRRARFLVAAGRLDQLREEGLEPVVNYLVPVLLDSGRANSAKALQEALFGLDVIKEETSAMVRQHPEASRSAVLLLVGLGQR